jgi:hypothetical protein
MRTRTEQMPHTTPTGLKCPQCGGPLVRNAVLRTPSVVFCLRCSHGGPALVPVSLARDVHGFPGDDS